MKHLFLSLIVGLTTLPLFAVELSQATNAQLVRELERRLGASLGQQAAAIYTCDNFGNLSIELHTLTSATSVTYGLGPNNCTEQSDTLSRYRSKIGTLTIAAICDTFGNLHKLPLRPDGKFGSPTKTQLGTYDKCITQARAINTAIN